MPDNLRLELLTPMQRISYQVSIKYEFLLVLSRGYLNGCYILHTQYQRAMGQMSAQVIFTRQCRWQLWHKIKFPDCQSVASKLLVNIES